MTHINKGKGSWNQVNHASSTSRFDPVIHVKPRLHNSNRNNLVEIDDSKQKTIDAVRIIMSNEKNKIHLSLLHSAVVRAAIMDVEIWAPPSPKKVTQYNSNGICDREESEWNSLCFTKLR